MSDLPFIPGLKLSQYLYEAAVRPILEKSFPALLYSAALIGTGSEVLGFDTPQSMDHDWGPRLMLFLAEADIDTYRLASSGRLPASSRPAFMASRWILRSPATAIMALPRRH